MFNAHNTQNLSKEEREKFLLDQTLSTVQADKENLLKYWQEVHKQMQNIYSKGD